jgi:uncharacterized protein YndB with AHSA1/START domain
MPTDPSADPSVNSIAGEPRVSVRRVMAATPRRVFDAWTDAAGMGAWLRAPTMPPSACALDVRVGGALRVVLYAPDGQGYEVKGEYRVVNAPRALAFTWLSEGSDHRETIVTLEFTPRAVGTEVHLTHDGLPDARSVEEHTEGWADILGQLAALLESR